jgi:gamma-glutamyltranspeptidase / glutathione hydrolase
MSHSTLEQIAIHGSNAFYEGEIGKSDISFSAVTRLTSSANHTINALRGANGTMTLSDLFTYTVSIRHPIHITYRGFHLYSTGVPSGGSVGLSILKIMEGYNLSCSSELNLNTHRLDEAMRFSYAARGELGDPDFFSDIDSFETRMLRPSNAAKIRSLILDSRTRTVSEYSPEYYMQSENHGTLHIITHRFIWNVNYIDEYSEPAIWEPVNGPRNRRNNEQRDERLLHPRHNQ